MPSSPDFALSLRLQEAMSGKPGTNENARLRPVVETPGGYVGQAGNGTECRPWSPGFLATVHGVHGDPGVHCVIYFWASTASAICLAASAADKLGVLTKLVITSIAAPRYFCRMVILWAKLRTSVPSLMASSRSFWHLIWQGLKPVRSMSSLAGIEPFALLKMTWKSFDIMRWARSLEPAR